MTTETLERAAPYMPTEPSRDRYAVCPWDIVIDEAEARGAFTRQEKLHACQWHLCAVGEAIGFRFGTNAGAVQHVQDYHPEACTEIRKLGLLFAQAVTDNRFDEARQIREQIRSLMGV